VSFWLYREWGDSAGAVKSTNSWAPGAMKRCDEASNTSALQCFIALFFAVFNEFASIILLVKKVI
jgi:hypothetical protein